MRSRRSRRAGTAADLPVIALVFTFWLSCLGVSCCWFFFFFFFGGGGWWY